MRRCSKAKFTMGVEKGSLLLQGEEGYRVIVDDGSSLVAGEEEKKNSKTTRGFKRSVAATVCLTAAAAVTLLLFTGTHGLCGQQQHHQHHQQHHHHHHHHPLPSAEVASSHLSKTLDANTIIVDNGRYEGDDLELFKKRTEADSKNNGAPVVLKRQSTTSSAANTTSTTTASATATATVLVDSQVHQPVLTPEGATLDNGVSNGAAGDVQDSCQVVLMDYVFAYSYGEPYIGESGGFFFFSPWRVNRPKKVLLLILMIMMMCKY